VTTLWRYRNVCFITRNLQGVQVLEIYQHYCISTGQQHKGVRESEIMSKSWIRYVEVKKTEQQQKTFTYKTFTDSVTYSK